MSNKKETKQKPVKEKVKKEKPIKEKNKNKKKRKHPKLILCIKIIIALIVIGMIVGAGIIAGLFFGFFGDDLKISAHDLDIKMENSVLIDLEGNQIATLNGDENRQIITLQEMGEYIPKAFIAIEDKRFYEHRGVDLARTFGATVKYIMGNSSYGGSTITQQLIKNATGENDKHWSRKVKEIAKAYQIENEMSKTQILEAYLNTIPLGGGAKNIYGIQVASRYYFDKRPDELSIAQSAYIAGINHSPNLYNPFKEKPNTEKINNRTKTVLNEMLTQGKINQEQYDSSIQEIEAGIAFKEGNITSNNTLTQNEEAAVKQVAKQYATEHGLEYEIALQKIRSSGYKIYITENKKIQNILDDAYGNTKDWIKTKQVNRKKEDGSTYKETIQMQSGMAIIDHKTGYVVASRGVLGEKSAWGQNRATDSKHQPGSSIKPIAVIAPSIQEGIITAGTVIDDTPVAYGSYKPHNDNWSFYGLMNIRYVLRVSRNIPEVKMMQKLTPQKSAEYLKSFGITSITDRDLGLSLALGGVSEGITPLEMAGAYATIANNGVYIEPTFYIKVEDSEGNVIMEKKQETRQVLSEQNAYIVKSLLTEPTGTGLTGTAGATGTGGVVKGHPTAGKTGTTNDSTATWFCGFTPYYAASMYFGYDNQEDGKNSAPGSGTVARRWSSIMTKAHEGLEKKKFEKPTGLVNATICKDSGLLATDTCREDGRTGRTYTEIYVKGTVPTESCSTHVKLKICKDTNKIANEFCTNTEEKVFITRKNSDTDLSWQKAADAEFMAPTETCDIHIKQQDTTKPVITLKGDETITLKLKETYKEPGATAKDDIDGDITDKIKIEIKQNDNVVEKIDTSKVGTYVIIYTVTDSAGNVGTKTRTIKVINGNNNTNTITNTITNSIDTANTITNTKH